MNLPPMQKLEAVLQAYQHQAADQMSATKNPIILRANRAVVQALQEVGPQRRVTIGAVAATLSRFMTNNPWSTLAQILRASKREFLFGLLAHDEDGEYTEYFLTDRGLTRRIQPKGTGPRLEMATSAEAAITCASLRPPRGLEGIIPELQAFFDDVIAKAPVHKSFTPQTV